MLVDVLVRLLPTHLVFDALERMLRRTGKDNAPYATMRLGVIISDTLLQSLGPTRREELLEQEDHSN